MRYHRPYADRAKIFVAFDALKGLRAALSRQERLIVQVPKAELSEDRIEEIDRVLRSLKPGDIVCAIYYDKGEYVQKTGIVSDTNAERKELWIVKTRISFDSLYKIEIFQ